VVTEFVDCAQSGMTDERPSFRGMIEEAKRQPEWSMILVYDYSRFSRSYDDTIKYLSELREYGISVTSVKENFDDYLKTVFKCGEDYVDRVSSATRAGLAMKAREGKHCGGNPPYGYDVDADGHLVVNHAEAEVVKKIFNLFVNNCTYREIEEQLEREGIRNRSGKCFSRRSFIEILKKRKYTGEFSWGRAPSNDSYTAGDDFILIPNGCPPIITEDIFNRAQELISRRTNGRAITSDKSKTLLAGTGCIICGCCREPLTVRQRSYRGQIYTMYTCPKHRKRGCPTKEVRAKDVDEFIYECLIDFLMKILRSNRVIEVSDADAVEQYKHELREHLTDVKVRLLLDELDARVVVTNDNIELEL